MIKPGDLETIQEDDGEEFTATDVRMREEESKSLSDHWTVLNKAQPGGKKNFPRSLENQNAPTARLKQSSNLP